MMFSQYVRMFIFLLSLCFTYIIALFFFPKIGDFIDEKTGQVWNQQLRDTIESWLRNAEYTKDIIEKKIENPAPNTSKNIEGRMGF